MNSLTKQRLAGCALTVAGLLCAGIASAQMTLDGIIAYWPLESGPDVEDVIGGNDGVVNGKSKEVAGWFGGAMEFDGITEIEIEGTDALNLNGLDTFSVSAWANVDSDDPVIGVVAGCCGSIVAQRDMDGWALRYDGRNAGLEMEFIVHGGGWAGDGGFGAPLPAAGEWHHYVGVLDGGTMKFYFDGEFQMKSAGAGAVVSNGAEAEIGHAGDGGFVGLIDEVVIYSIALDDDQVMANFETPGLAVDPVGKLATSWASLKGLR